MILTNGWTETTVSDPVMPGAEIRVYRRTSGNLVLTLDARLADLNGGDDLDAFFGREWAQFLDVLRRHG